uniref:Protein C3orf33 homolog n=1 Tax=Phallusia mammillata TaxID=59560 RepID=A0A6F9D8M2_9ASCI|nr:protein C3orf33 homolog [Phallusia mammillata]
MIWFQLWSNDLPEDSNMNSLHCLVSTPKWPFNRCLNVDLLNEGMAEFQPLPQNLMEQRKGLALAERLVKAQNSAIKKRRGIWYEPTKMQSYVASAKDGYAQIQPKQWGRNFASSLKNIPSSLTQWFKRKT